MLPTTNLHPSPRVAARGLLGPLIASASLASLVLFSACFTTYGPPDLGGLYNRAAQYHRPERNPIVVIPGLMGSKLEDSDSGRIVWGAFTRKAARPGDPEGARLIALPMERGVSLSELREPRKPTERGR